MLLRAAIVILIVLNLGVAAWWWAGGGAATPVSAPAKGSEPQLRLLAEARQQLPAPVEDAAGMPEAETAGPAPTNALTAAPAAERCLRLGPFADAPTRDALLADARALADRVLPREAPARAGRGWQVSLPPLASREEALAMAERMRAAGVADLYVMTQGEAANSIALGRYGSEEAARRREASLRALGFAAQASPVGGGAAQWWLDLRLRADADPASLRGRVGVRAVDCATLR